MIFWMILDVAGLISGVPYGGSEKAPRVAFSSSGQDPLGPPAASFERLRILTEPYGFKS